jgi:hypothetical protein
MHEWIDNPRVVHKAPPPAPDPERYKGCGLTAFALVGVIMFIAIGAIMIGIDIVSS